MLALAGAIALPAPARAAGLRVATVDWAVLETLLALGVVPVAATELLQFHEVAVEPAVPASVTDLGLRGTVNFELLRLTRPDLIFSSSFYVSSEPRMRLIAPVESFAIYARGQPPFDAAVRMTRSIGQRLGLAEAAERYIAETEAEFAGLRERLKSHDGRAVIPINLGDPRHFRVFGADSMFGEVLSRLNLANAWTEATSYSAMAPVGLEALARVPEAWIVMIPPVPPDAERILARSAFWNALPNVRAGRVLRLGSINPYGALPAARRFARLLVEAFGHAGTKPLG
ncbi:iron-siderophore ABC transporter substrate-binding protein [Bosea caraganae]|uniref:Iron-siderophore ABC transporter substrate-binding protein n=1 Tax=Bosea caraganae TaxID=2763117 RepID=A0A370L8D5_9HYPH|nr:iron-siderophore ABC transporter substrate-binding protein [Bosea caraganae]RDJ30545.1 iron-siderophore ABC transporter substrate-binding protein [Bosea caraganae]